MGLGLSLRLACTARRTSNYRLNADYLWFADEDGAYSPTDLISAASAGQGFTLVDSSNITPTTSAISDDPFWILNGDGDLTPTT